MIFCELFFLNPRIVSVSAGQTLFREAEEGNLMYVLSIGSAEVIVNNRVVEKLCHGSVVGEMGIVSPGPRSATVVACEGCEFVEIDEKRFGFLVQQTPYFALQIMRLMTERLRNTNLMLPAIEDV